MPKLDIEASIDGLTAMLIDQSDDVGMNFTTSHLVRITSSGSNSV